MELAPSAVTPTGNFIEDPAGAAPASAPSPEVAVNTSFGGLSNSDNAALAGFRVLPPDNGLAVGPNHVFQMVNVVGRITDRAGVSLTSFTLRSFFQLDALNETDPRVIYDALSGRWFATYLQFSFFPFPFGTSSVVLAVSTSSDPTGTFCRYRLSQTFLQDFPMLGVSDDKVAVSYNAFTFSDGSFLGSGYYVVNKGDLLACADPVRMVSNAPNFSRTSIHPAQSLSSTRDLFLAMHNPGATSLSVLAVSGVPGAGLLSERTASVPVGPWNDPPSAVQPDLSVRLDTGDGRPLSVVWQYNSLFVAGNQSCVPPGDFSVRSCLRVIEVRTGNMPSLGAADVRQNFAFGANGSYYSYPALGPDGAGNLAIVFTRCSGSEFASLRATGRLVTDAPNTLQGSVEITAGGGSQTHPTGRLGDYSGAALDPVDPSKVWVSGEYIRSTDVADWGTSIAGLRLDSPVSVFVSGFYQIVLGRIPEAGGLAFWAGLVSANCNALGFSTVGDAFFDSPEFRTARPLTLTGLVATLYRTFLGREPEPGGLAFWAGMLRQERVNVAASFIASAEFQNLVPDRRNPAFVTPVVTRFYTEILGRAPDPPGLAFWVNFIVSTQDLEGAAVAFLTSAEFEARPLTFRDYVRVLYRTFLGRDPDVTGLDFWEGMLRAHLLGVINGAFVPSQEFQGRIPLVCGS